MKNIILFLLLLIFINEGVSHAQQPNDSLSLREHEVACGYIKDTTLSTKINTEKKDTFFLFKKEFTPKGATIRSAILPGWGQIYNKRYWEAPLAVAAVGIPIGLYIDNRIWYKRAAAAVEVAFKISNNIADTVLINTLNAAFKDPFNARYKNAPNGIPLYSRAVTNTRNYYRRNMDYSLLWTLIMWGINVADAAAFAHLKGFDVGDDLSMKIQPTYFPIANAPGVKLVFALK